MTEQAFMQQERDAFHRFMRQFLIDDFQSRTMPGYRRDYRCDCGYRTADPRALYRHTHDASTHAS